MKKTLLFTVIALLSGIFSPARAQTPTEGEEIDLGLSVNWRAYDLGSTTPSTPGTKYAYAVKTPSDYRQNTNHPLFSWDTYQIELPAEGIAGNPDYDAAAYESEGYWRMATKDEWQELLDGCNAQLVTIDGNTGFLFTSKTNGNSIFIPSLDYFLKYYTADYSGSSAYYMYGTTFWGLPEIKLQEAMQREGPWQGMPLRPVCDPVSVPLESVELTADKTEIFVNTYAQLTATVLPEGAKINGTYTSSDEAVATVTNKGLVKGVGGGSAVITLSDGEFSASVTIIVTAVETDLTQYAVDLGLSVDWKTMNEGAQSYTETGNRYAFAVTNTTTYASANDYPYYNNLNYRLPEDVLGNKAYDAVTFNAGEDSGSRLPSKIEMEELMANCTVEKVTLDGAEYFRFTSNINGRYIFFPVKDTGVYYTGSTNSARNKAYALNLSAMPPAVQEVSQPYKSYAVRGVVEHPVIPDLEAITFDCEALSLYTENSKTVTAAASPVGALLDGLVWSSSDESIATVDANGNVTGVSEGTAVITATVGEISASFEVNVKDPGICLDEMVDMGTDVLWAPCELGATVPSASGNLYYWGALEPCTDGVADYSRWNDPGIDDIGATEFDVVYKEMGNGWRIPTRSELYQLLRNCSYEWITHGGRYGVLVISKTTEKRMFFPYVDGRDYIYYFGTEIFRNNSSDGLPFVEGLYIKPPKIDTSGEKPWTPSPMRPVFDPSFVPPLEQIVIESESLSLYDNETLQLTAKTVPDDAEFTALVWTSSDEAVATVNEEGLVSGISAGTVTITATDGEIAASVELTVIHFIPPLEQIVIESESLSLYDNETLQLTAKTVPGDAEFTALVWTSSDEAVATVNEEGLVCGISAGTVTITATDGEIAASVELTVIHFIPPLEQIVIEAESESLEILVGETIILQALPYPEEAVFENLTWASTDFKIATLEDFGVVTGVSEGTVTITAADGAINASVDITVKKVSGVEGISNEEKTIEAIYTIEGICVSPVNLTPGAYIIIYSDGTAAKKLVR